MRKLYVFGLALSLSTISMGQVGINTSTPKATLDVESSTSGVLIPRMTFAQATEASVTHHQSELVYITDGDGNAGSPTENQGFYFYSTSSNSWIPLATSSVINIAGNMPVMTTAERDAIVSPTVGETILNSDHLYPNYYVSSLAGWWEPNDGHIRINSGNNVKPRINNFADGAIWKITYQTPLQYSSEPTTTYPKNMNPEVNPWYDTNIYRLHGASGRFIENFWIGQTTRWRLVFNISKDNSPFSYITVYLSNPESGFQLSRQILLPKEKLIGKYDIELSTISDYDSLPVPFGNGNGYEIWIKNDSGATIPYVELESLTRISEFSTYKYPMQP